MHEADLNELLKAASQRSLTPEQQNRLRSFFPEDEQGQAALEEELALNQLLVQVPDAPIASNFTAQVMQLVASEEKKFRQPLARSTWTSWIFGSWLRQAAVASITAAVMLFSYQHYLSAQRQEVAASIATVSTVASASSIDMLQDFEAINRLSQISAADDLQKVDFELLSALQSDVLLP
jgi:hypothetical protein